MFEILSAGLRAGWVMLRGTRCRPLWLCLAVVASMPTESWAVDIDPGDYQAAPVGANLYALYYQHASRGSSYQDGNRQAGSPELTSDIGILRSAFFRQFLGYEVDPQFLLPYGNLDAGGSIAGLGSKSALGDPAIASSMYFINRPEDKTVFGLTPFLFFPLGDYDKDSPLNVAENRWKFALQAGYVGPLAGPLLFDLAADFTIFGNNTDCRAQCGATEDVTMAERTLYQFQAFVRWPIRNTTTLFVGGGDLEGGETKIDNVRQNNRQSTQYVRFGVSQFLTSNLLLTINCGRDLNVENGFHEDSRINLRLILLTL